MNERDGDDRAITPTYVSRFINESIPKYVIPDDSRAPDDVVNQVIKDELVMRIVVKENFSRDVAHLLKILKSK